MTYQLKADSRRLKNYLKFTALARLDYCFGFWDLLMSGSESLDCEAPASLWISQETGRIIRTNAKRRRGSAVQSQSKAPDRETISEWRGKQDVLDLKYKPCFEFDFASKSNSKQIFVSVSC
jgi:hypothetical protein